MISNSLFLGGVYVAVEEVRLTQISEEKWQKLEEIIGKHRGKRGVLIQVLHEAQELLGYLPREVQEKVALELDIPLSEIYSVVSFYALFSLKPKGRHQISICKGTACYVRGSDRILEKLEETLGIRAGDTTDDGRFSVEVVRCMGACGLGPVMRIDDDIYARLKPDRVPGILEKYK
ncbi:MAG: NADH-quinone oxidoreductase subunit NuoE [Firmicutes bacterium]|nr:NADH-quinone oxidoreductase subunit NuoE [Bacillota bacterium]